MSAYNTEEAPIEISMPGQGNEYIDLRRSRLYAKCKILKADGTALKAQEMMGIIYLPLQSLRFQIYLHEWKISGSEHWLLPMESLS